MSGSRHNAFFSTQKTVDLQALFENAIEGELDKAQHRHNNFCVMMKQLKLTHKADSRNLGDHLNNIQRLATANGVTIDVKKRLHAHLSGWTTDSGSPRSNALAYIGVFARDHLTLLPPNLVKGLQTLGDLISEDLDRAYQKEYDEKERGLMENW